MNINNNLLWLFVASLSFMARLTFGQSLNDKAWVMGNQVGMDFNSGSPIPFTSSLKSHEGCAVQCDDQGNILFYTNGEEVWDRNHNRMAQSGLQLYTSWQGNNIQTYNSSSQGVAIVPDLRDKSRYFIFNIQAVENYPRKGYLYYSVVDMALASGMGDIMSSQRNILVDSLLGEQMLVIKGTECNYWLVVHRRDGDFRSYSISSTGIDPVPVSTFSATSPGFFYGQGKISYGLINSKIALTAQDWQPSSTTSIKSILELHDFDPATGKVSNAQQLMMSVEETRYNCFSPDNSKLYITTHTGGALRQFDLSQPNLAAIIASNTVIYQRSFEDLKIGPDNKIYVIPGYGESYLSCITQPNQPGLACNFQLNAVSWSMNNYVRYSLPNYMVSRFSMLSGETINHDTTICFSQTASLQAPTSQNYIWYDGSVEKDIIVDKPGTYWVKGVSGCRERTDSFHVNFIDFEAGLGKDTAICADIELSVAVNGVDSTAKYLWQDGNVGQTFLAKSSGTYSVNITWQGCEKSDTIEVFQKGISIDLGNDTLICDGDVYKLNATTADVQYTWQDGYTEPVYNVRKPGTYKVVISNETCTSEDSIIVDSEICDCFTIIPTAFTPNNDGRNDIFRILLQPDCNRGRIRLHIYNRWGQQVFYTDTPTNAWDGSFNGVPQSSDTYTYWLEFISSRGKARSRTGDVILIR